MNIDDYRAVVAGNPKWDVDANCQDRPLDWFFAPRGADLSPAMRTCAACPVRDECLAADLIRYNDHGGYIVGIRGGMTAIDRRTLLRKLNGSEGKRGPIPGADRLGVDHEGTEGNYTKHRRQGETPCDACKAAHATRRATLKVVHDGTDNNYRKHLRLGQEPCQACKDAHTRKVNSWRLSVAS